MAYYEFTDLKTLDFMPWERVSEIAREIWGQRVLVYRSTTNNFYFVTLLPDHHNFLNVFDTGIMPSDVLGYGTCWSEAFLMALDYIPVISKFKYEPHLIYPTPPKIKPKKEHNTKNWKTDNQPLIPPKPLKKK